MTASRLLLALLGWSCALCWPGAVRAAGMPSFTDIGDLSQPCSGFSCRRGKAPAPKKNFVFTANGCGTAAMPIDAGSDFQDCCNWHDACYSTCGMKKAKCEKRLEKCMKDKCAALEDRRAREECQSTSSLFSIGAKMMGCPAYQAAQKEACQCIPAADAASVTRERLVHFLTENNAPEGDLEDDKLDALLAKYERQEPKMFLRLLKKYPTALQIDPQKTSFMDDILKSGGEDASTEGANKKRSKGRFNVNLKEREADEHIEL